MALTAQQLSDLRADLGDEASSFSDDKLNRNYDRVAAAPSADVRYEATLALCFRQLLAASAKLHDYKAGAVDEKLSQVRKHLEGMYEMYRPSLERAMGTSSQFVRGHLTPRANPYRRTPDENILEYPEIDELE